MEYKPLFSVLIANYNNGKYLMDAIESVRKQTYTNWEIILVDDASTDISHELYTQLEQDERIHIYYNEQNQGCGYTKRRCAELANGEICGFLDPDDVILPQTLKLEAEIHLNYPNVSVVYSKVQYCDIDFNVLREGSVPDFKSGETYFDHRNHGAMNFASYKKIFYNLTSGINPNLKAAVDQDLYFKIEEVGEIYILDDVTYKYVIQGHLDSISTTFKNYSKLWYWNLIARRDTCVRRHIDESILIDDLQIILDNYAEAISYQKELEIRSSRPYRLGKLLLKPFSWLRRVFGKK